jgi:hypothetical protein
MNYKTINWFKWQWTSLKFRCFEVGYALRSLALVIFYWLAYLKESHELLYGVKGSKKPVGIIRSGL